jgi:hypothetical protein
MADQQPFVLDQLAPARPPRRRWPWLAGGALLALAIAAGGIYFATRGDDTPAKATTAAKPVSSTLAITGTLTLARPGFVWDAAASVCVGQNGYDDISGGVQVVITNPAGVTVAVGRLGDGATVSGPGALAASGCAFPFSVAVPAGLGFYGVEVSHRGRLQYSEADIHRGLALTLG